MANEEHLEILRSGVEHWNAWREQNADVTNYLANLRDADLTGANLFDANLSGEIGRAHV